MLTDQISQLLEIAASLEVAERGFSRLGRHFRRSRHRAESLTSNAPGGGKTSRNRNGEMS
jgi:hypothetical protein